MSDIPPIDTEPKYPAFRDPEKYMRLRESRSLLGRLKTSSERRALDRVLAPASGVRTICDVPAGPGRLFPYWRSRDWRVLGYDISEQMVAAATQTHQREGLEGEVGHADAFNLKPSLSEQPDLVASVRFIYYFDAERRVELLQSLAAATRRYVLVQYKTTETLRGQITLVRRSEENAGDKRHLRQDACSQRQILEELRAAGLVPLRLEPVGEFSDRIFVLAEKPQADPALRDHTGADTLKPRRPRRLRLTAAVLLALALLYCINLSRTFWTQDEAYWGLGTRAVLTGDWILPSIAPGQTALHPPLAFLPMALASIPSSGTSEAAIRLVGVLAALGALGATYHAARRRLGRWSALVGMIVLGTSHEFWDQAATAGSHMIVLWAMVVAWGSLFGMLWESGRRRRWWFAWGGLAAAVLAGGAGWLALSIAVVMSYAIWEFGIAGAWGRLRRTRPLAGLVLAAGPWLGWLGLVAWTHGTAMAWQVGLGHPLELLLADDKIYFYLLELPLALMPWTLLLPLVAWHHWRRPRGRAASSALSAFYRFCAAAVLMTLGLLSLVGENEERWLLALLPWAAVLIGDALWRRLCLLAPDEIVEPSDDERAFAGRLLGGRRGRKLLGAMATLLLALVIYSAIGAWLIDERRSPVPFIQLIHRELDPREELILVDADDLRFLYYLAAPYSLSTKTRTDLDALHERMAGPEPVSLLVRAQDLRRLATMGDTPLFISESADFRNREYLLLTNRPEAGARPLLVAPMAEPAGLVWHSGRQSLFMVGERGNLAEIDPAGRLLRQTRLGGDLEGITISADGERLIISDGTTNQLVEVSVATLEPLRRHRLELGLVPGPHPRQIDIEGLCLLPDGAAGRLFGVNESQPPLLMELELDPQATGDVAQARALGMRLLAMPDLTEMALAADRRTLLAFSDQEGLLFEINPEGGIGRRWLLPGSHREALAMRPDGTLYVCDNNGLLTLYSAEELAGMEISRR